LSALFRAAAHRRHRRRRRGEASRPPFSVALSPTRRPESPPPLLCFALALHLPCHAPRTSSRPPPRRRRGELAAEPQDPFQRAHEHLKDPSDLFLSFFCSLLAPTP